MNIHASEQGIVDTLSAFIPMDVIKYEIIPRYRLPTPEEVEKGKRMFNRCLVELQFAFLRTLCNSVLQLTQIFAFLRTLNPFATFWPFLAIKRGYIGNQRKFSFFAYPEI